MGLFLWIKDKKSVKILSKTSINRQKSYNTVEWHNISKFYKMEHPLCELCMLENKIKPVELIHHIQKFNDLPSILLQRTLLTDTDNLIGLCGNCHHAIHLYQDELTEKQKNFLKYRKDLLFKKYLLLDMPILITDDLNIHKNLDK